MNMKMHLLGIIWHELLSTTSKEYAKQRLELLVDNGATAAIRKDGDLWRLYIEDVDDNVAELAELS